MIIKLFFEGKTTVLDGFSKLSKIQQLRKTVEEKVGCPAALQRLLHKGKQLEDGHTLHDYRFGMDDVVNLMRRQVLREMPVSPVKMSPQKTKPERVEATSEVFLTGDKVDVTESGGGAWYEAEITGIFDMSPEDAFESSDGKAYRVVYHSFEEEAPSFVGLQSIRPRCHTKIAPEECQPGMKILATFNPDKPKKRGFWYDCTVKSAELESRLKSYIKASISLGEGAVLDDKKLLFLDELYLIEENVVAKGREPLKNNNIRTAPPRCDRCDDVPGVVCKDCCCEICKNKDRPDSTLVCDDCNSAYHIDCLDPPLEKIPEEDWFCPDCKMPDDIVVKAGSNPLQNRKTANVPAYNPKSKRDWGKGYATAGRTKECTKVSKHHFGPIPGIEVGMSWLYRMQLSEEGIHRPPVAGIAGTPKDGANSIVVSGGYEGDADEGNTFWYTGAGGRDLSGNKRTGCQAFDQTLEKTNLALAVSCSAKVDKDKGGDAGDKWKKGKPIRVVRSAKLAKHSKYAPSEGLRYDGLYKIVKYGPEKGPSGFLVWRYLFKRDDPTPAPWTKEGKLAIAKNGYKCIYPPNYDPNKKSDSKKRKKTDDDGENEENNPKLAKFEYEIDEKYSKLASEDKINKSTWDDILKLKYENKLKFLNKVEEEFACVCCQELIYKPVTTKCVHNICEGCLKRSFQCKIYNCPFCREELGKEYEFVVNKQLRDALNELFPNYEAGRD